MSFIGSAFLTLSRNLFPFERPLTRGEQLYFRIFEVLIATASLRLAWQWADYVQRLDRVLKPQGIAHHLDITFLFGDGVAYALAGVLTLCLILGVTRRSASAYAGALVIMHLLYVSRHSLGKASHVAHCVGMALVALTLGTALFRGSAALLQRFVMGFVIFFLGTAYTLAGICKLVYTGLDWPNGAHLALWLAECGLDNRSAFGHFELNVIQSLVAEHRVLGTMSLACGLAAELAAFLVWFERCRPWLFTWLLMMHIGIGLTMSIYFSYNIYLLMVLACPGGRVIDWALRRVSASSADPVHELQ